MARDEFPDWLVPMAATLTAERFTGDEWVFERKLDGIRLMAYKNGADVSLWSRNQLRQDGAYPSVVEAVSALPFRQVILDGEATGVWGRTGRTHYHVFDVLWLEGDVTGLPYFERSALLDNVPMTGPMVRVERVEGDAPWERACREGWEGVIAKHLTAPYEHRRSKQWLKMKCEASQEFVVGGFTDPQGKRVGFGALLVGYYEGEQFVFAGKVGTGLDTRLLLELRDRFDAILLPASPFTRATGLPRKAHWVKPEIVVQVSFIEWTVHGKLRHSRLLGVRIDKSSRDVVRETP